MSVCLCVFIGSCMPKLLCTWSEDSFWGSLLSFYPVGSGPSSLMAEPKHLNGPLVAKIFIPFVNKNVGMMSPREKRNNHLNAPFYRNKNFSLSEQSDVYKLKKTNLKLCG